MCHSSDNAVVNYWKALEPYCPPRHQGTENRLVLSGPDAGGAFSVVRGDLEFGGVAEPHLHRVSSQFLHIIEGACECEIGGEMMSLEAGDSVFIPTGVPHAVRVTSEGGVRLLNVYQPPLSKEDIIEVENGADT